MTRKNIFRIVKSPGTERYTVERKGTFGWKHVDVCYTRKIAEDLVAELEGNPTGVVYLTGHASA